MNSKVFSPKICNLTPLQLRTKEYVASENDSDFETENYSSDTEFV